MKSCLASLFALFLVACGGQSSVLPDLSALDDGRLPRPDLSVTIPQLGPCTDSPDRSLNLNAASSVTILVHGCFGSAGKFRSLAQVMAFHGQQTACFSYDDRDSLMLTSGQLATAVDQLASQMKAPQITVLGHSQGGLVARKALIEERQDRVRAAADLRLVTISAPFAGISVARTCGNTLLRVASLGLLDLTCWAVSGDKWHEITSASNFIRQPGTLLPNVRQHLKIATDEAEICRRQNADGRCLKDDYVFSLAEQYFPPVDRAPGVLALDLRAGHAGVIGESGEVPRELISILQREGVIAATEPQRLSALERLLRRIYGG
jgi:pimeloyl-ACP methyl ester carboxylesterase